MIGALSEASDISTGGFCGGLACIGQLAVNQLTHALSGRYLMDVLYDKTIAVHFVHWLRGDMKFPSVDDLILQMRRDQADTLTALGAPA